MEGISHFYDLLEENNFTQVNIDEAIVFLKRKGASQMETALVIRNYYNLRLGEVNMLVQNSSVWTEFKESNNDLLNNFFSPSSFKPSEGDLED